MEGACYRTRRAAAFVTGQADHHTLVDSGEGQIVCVEGGEEKRCARGGVGRRASRSDSPVYCGGK